MDPQRPSSPAAVTQPSPNNGQKTALSQTNIHPLDPSPSQFTSAQQITPNAAMILPLPALSTGASISTPMHIPQAASSDMTSIQNESECREIEFDYNFTVEYANDPDRYPEYSTKLKSEVKADPLTFRHAPQHRLAPNERLSEKAKTHFVKQVYHSIISLDNVKSSTSGEGYKALATGHKNYLPSQLICLSHQIFNAYTAYVKDGLTFPGSAKSRFLNAEDDELTPENRLREICKTLREWKSVFENAMKSQEAVQRLVAFPIKVASVKRLEHIANKTAQYKRTDTYTADVHEQLRKLTERDYIAPTSLYRTQASGSVTAIPSSFETRIPDGNHISITDDEEKQATSSQNDVPHQTASTPKDPRARNAASVTGFEEPQNRHELTSIPINSTEAVPTTEFYTTTPPSPRTLSITRSQHQLAFQGTTNTVEPTTAREILSPFGLNPHSISSTSHSPKPSTTVQPCTPKLQLQNKDNASPDMARRKGTKAGKARTIRKRKPAVEEESGLQDPKKQPRLDSHATGSADQQHDTPGEPSSSVMPAISNDSLGESFPSMVLDDSNTDFGRNTAGYRATTPSRFLDPALLDDDTEWSRIFADQLATESLPDPFFSGLENDFSEDLLFTDHQNNHAPQTQTGIASTTTATENNPITQQTTSPKRTQLPDVALVTDQSPSTNADPVYVPWRFSDILYISDDEGELIDEATPAQSSNTNEEDINNAAPDTSDAPIQDHEVDFLIPGAVYEVCYFGKPPIKDSSIADEGSYIILGQKINENFYHGYLWNDANRVVTAHKNDLWFISHDFIMAHLWIDHHHGQMQCTCYKDDDRTQLAPQSTFCMNIDTYTGPIPFDPLWYSVIKHDVHNYRDGLLELPANAIVGVNRYLAPGVNEVFTTLGDENEVVFRAVSEEALWYAGQTMEVAIECVVANLAKDMAGN